MNGGEKLGGPLNRHCNDVRDVFGAVGGIDENVARFLTKPAAVAIRANAEPSISAQEYADVQFVFPGLQIIEEFPYFLHHECGFIGFQCAEWKVHPDPGL